VLRRFVIHIKAGAYFENVEVERKKKMLVFIGDGIGKTVVKANRSVVDGWTTFRSATVGESKFSFFFLQYLKLFMFHTVIGEVNGDHAAPFRFFHYLLVNHDHCQIRTLATTVTGGAMYTRDSKL